jgi:putative Ca2+/H+ antiporter (TMEM165/GDT1 family)
MVCLIAISGASLIAFLIFTSYVRIRGLKVRENGELEDSTKRVVFIHTLWTAIVLFMGVAWGIGAITLGAQSKDCVSTRK